MFSNIGGKLKTLAKFVCWIGIIVSVILGLSAIVQANQMPFMKGTLIISGLTTIGVGSLCSWIASLFTCGFGQLIENTDAIKKQLSSEPEMAKEPDGCENGSATRQEQADAEDPECPPETEP